MSVKPLIVCVALAACFCSVAWVALAREASPHAAGEPNEVLLGSQYCSANADSAWISISFSATGDLFQDRYWGGSIGGAGTPAEICERATQAVVRALDAGACTRGPTEIYDDADGAARSFQYSCSGSRNALVAVIADVAASVLRASP